MKKLAIALTLLAAVGAFAQAPQPSSSSLSPSAKRALVEKALTLRAGDTYETVIGRLGKPTFGATASEGRKKDLISQSLKYVVRKSGSAALDEHIDIYMDKNNRVDGIYLNVELK